MKIAFGLHVAFLSVFILGCDERNDWRENQEKLLACSRTENFNEALTIAKKEQKPILIYFYAQSEHFDDACILNEEIVGQLNSFVFSALELDSKKALTQEISDSLLQNNDLHITTLGRYNAYLQVNYTHTNACRTLALLNPNGQLLNLAPADVFTSRARFEVYLRQALNAYQTNL